MRPLDAKGRDDYYRRVADVLIAQVEAGTAPWTQSWQAGERVRPYNLKTGKSYRGGNSTWLASVAEMRGYQDERWGTYRQIAEAGGQVRRGQKGASIIYWQWERKQAERDANGAPRLDGEGRPVYRTTQLERPRTYAYTVFNAEQAGGLPPRPAKSAGSQWERSERVEKLFKNCGAEREHACQDRVFYDLGRDLIVLPHREQFPDPAGYYQSALHELGHWTGHPDRMDRASLVEGIRAGPKSTEYAREELRAEISSMITGERLDVGHDGSRSAAYVGHWVKTLRDHPQEIYLASRDAEQISDFLMERGRMVERGRGEERAALPEAHPSAPEREPAPLPAPPPPVPLPARKAGGGQLAFAWQGARPGPGRER